MTTTMTATTEVNWATAFSHPPTVTRKQRIYSLFALPVPQCASTEWKYEHYKIVSMLRDLFENSARSPPDLWKQELLAEALRVLHTIQDPTESPAVASRTDHVKWTDVMVRRIIAEAVWEDGGSLSFYDCCEALKVGRSRAAAIRLSAQARSSWTAITQTDFTTEFSLRS